MSQRLKRSLFHQSTCSKRSFTYPEIVLPAAKAVDVEAFPVKAPTKDVEVIDTHSSNCLLLKEQQLLLFLM
jgi:hypothetical protein